jgi:hypothetical protein|eukprot:COSAG01_NODE_7082_length_3361_cov_1.988964_4_plen_33_part_00
MAGSWASTIYGEHTVMMIMQGLVGCAAMRAGG